MNADYGAIDFSLFWLPWFLSFTSQPVANQAPKIWWERGGVEFANSRLRLKLNPDRAFEETLEKKQDSSVVRRTSRWELAEFEGESLVLHGALVARDYSGTVESDDGTGNGYCA
jgi:hypothetical protein